MTTEYTKADLKIGKDVMDFITKSINYLLFKKITSPITTLKLIDEENPDEWKMICDDGREFKIKLVAL